MPSPRARRDQPDIPISNFDHHDYRVFWARPVVEASLRDGLIRQIKSKFHSLGFSNGYFPHYTNVVKYGYTDIVSTRYTDIVAICCTDIVSTLYTNIVAICYTDIVGIRYTDIVGKV